MGIKELELFTIKIGYSLLVISSNYSFGWGPLRWRAAHLPCRGPVVEPVAGDLLPLTCRAAVLPLGPWRRACRREPAVPLTCRRTYRRVRGYFAKLTERVSRITVIFTWPG